MIIIDHEARKETEPVDSAEISNLEVLEVDALPNLETAIERPRTTFTTEVAQ